MLPFQQGEVLLPGGQGQAGVTGEEVAPLEGERVPLARDQPVPHRVLPVGAMDGQFPGVVAVLAWPVQELREGDAAQAPEKVGAVPGRLAEALVQEQGKAVDLAGHGHPPGWGGNWGYNSLGPNPLGTAIRLLGRFPRKKIARWARNCLSATSTSRPPRTRFATCSRRPGRFVKSSFPPIG